MWQPMATKVKQLLSIIEEIEAGLILLMAILAIYS